MAPARPSVASLVKMGALSSARVAFALWALGRRPGKVSRMTWMHRWLPRLLGLLAGLLMAAWVPAAWAQPVRIAGVGFDREAQVGGQALRLNGVGVRAVAWFTGYAAGLYLAQATDNAAQAMAAPGAKRVQMRMMWDVPAEEFVKAFNKGVTRNTPKDAQPALAERMAKFSELMRGVGQVKKGDVVNLDFVPAQGLVFSINGRARGAPIPGADLYAALLGVFLGERPVDAKLKAGLLGAPPG